MTQNLRIQNKNLTSADSDILSNFALPSSISNALKGFNNYNTSYVYIDTNDMWGGYYSWYAATAGSGIESSSSQTAPYSICPKNWKIPTNTELSTLVTKYDVNSGGSMLKPPVNLTLNGTISSGAWIHPQNTNYIDIWSSSIVTNYSPIFLYLSSSGDFGLRCGAGLCGCNGCGDPSYSGKGVRCVFLY